MSLSSTSSPAEIEAALVDNADYAEVKDKVKAQALIQACRIWIFKNPVHAAHGEASAQFNVQGVGEALKEAVEWLRAADPSYTGWSAVGFNYSRM